MEDANGFPNKVYPSTFVFTKTSPGADFSEPVTDSIVSALSAPLKSSSS